MATEENAAIQSIDIEIAGKKKLLLGAIDNARLAVTDKIKSIDDRINEFESSFVQLPSKEAELARLNRVYEVNQKFYQLLLEKKVEFAIARAGVISNNIILDRARPVLAPLSPNRKFVLASSMLLGFLISFLIIFIKMD